VSFLLVYVYIGAKICIVLHVLFHLRTCSYIFLLLFYISLLLSASLNLTRHEAALKSYPSIFWSRVYL